MLVEPTELVRIFYNAFNTGDLDSLDRVFSPNWVDNTLPAGRPPGLAGIKAATEILRSALPDLHCEMKIYWLSRTRRSLGSRLAVLTEVALWVRLQQIAT